MSAGSVVTIGGEVVRPAALRAALAAIPDEGWLQQALESVTDDPAAIGRHWAVAARRCGRGPLAALPDWTAGEAARVLLLTALPPEHACTQAELLYRDGDAGEKRAVLRALPMLAVGPQAVGLLHDAIRTNDPRLVAAALGPYAAHLDSAAWRQAVLKCVFMDIQLSTVADLAERIDAELLTMLASLADERHAAGRSLPADAAALLRRRPKECRPEE